MWLNVYSSRISVATGISSVATFVTFIGIPVSAALGVASMTGAIASGIISVLIKKYQKKLKKVTKLIDIITPVLVVFERVIYGALKDGIIDEEEFNTLQTLHLETLNELTGVDCRMEAENRSLVEKSLMEEIMTRFLSLCSSFPRAKLPQEVCCTIESCGGTYKRSVCLKSINGLLNH